MRGLDAHLDTVLVTTRPPRPASVRQIRPPPPVVGAIADGRDGVFHAVVVTIYSPRPPTGRPRPQEPPMAVLSSCLAGTPDRPSRGGIGPRLAAVTDSLRLTPPNIAVTQAFAHASRPLGLEIPCMLLLLSSIGRLLLSQTSHFY